MDPVALQRFLDLRESVRARMDGGQTVRQQDNSGRDASVGNRSSVSQASPLVASSATGSVAAATASATTNYATKVAELVRDAQSQGKSVRNLGNFLDIRA